jgi:subtilase family serine protease
LRGTGVLLRLATIAFAFAFTCASASALPGIATPTPPRVSLPGLVPRFVRSLTPLGPSAPAGRVVVLVELKLRDQAGLDRLVERVSTPGSGAYGRYLTPPEFRARFAPPPAAVAAVERYLTASGFRVVGVPRNRAFVAASGTVAQAEAAFDTTLADFRVAGRVAHAPVKVPSLPPALGRYVRRVVGLDTAAVAHPLASPPPAFVNAPPCSSSFGQQTATSAPPAFGSLRPWVVCGYTPRQLQDAYGIAAAQRAGIDGRGQRVAIIDAYDSPTITQDADTYSSRHGLPPAQITRHASVIASNMPEAGVVDPQGWAGEETLDVEAVHSMAPRASIVYEGADTDLDISLTAAMNDVVDNKRAQIVSNSYGFSGDFDNSGDYDPILQQAAAEGIGVYFSSGDEGDETKDPNGPGDREVDSPANDPLVTAVGGTSLAVGSRGQYLFETGWGTSESMLANGAWSPSPPGDWIYGGGGGTSQTYAEPKYQVGVVPPGIASYWQGKPAEADAGDANGQIHVPGRAVPDVSLDADPNTGFVEGITEDWSNPALGVSPPDDYHYGEYRIGGTSLSCPLFAGMMALSDQLARHPHGFANPALYAALGRGAFRDVKSPAAPVAEVRNDYGNGTSGSTTTTLRSFNQLNTLTARPGYDDVTGLGSPNGATFLSALAGR